MKTRTRYLSEGWYPNSKKEIESLLASWLPHAPTEEICAGISPHAGWTFCGSIIAQVSSRLPENIDTIAVLGGHNPPGMPVIAYRYDAWRTPTGTSTMDRDLFKLLENRSGEPWIDEEYADNTVEAVLTMALALRSKAAWMAWRLPADKRAVEFGIHLAAAAKTAGRRLAVLGSTDLTHYGPQYGFCPPESRANPVQWVKKRDERILEALVNFEGEKALTLANKEQSACSSGGAVGAMSFAKTAGAVQGRVLSYATSRDVHPGNSFVAYAGVAWN
ncbi:MAG: AmmeMemoRadiSam system protein B [Spirochaeta sp. LUC14_002_19_P3]|nr:MAG: AmmeMemoRadiSam system protein B [Spirochaeta sp. LUC14_002_19_P3]